MAKGKGLFSGKGEASADETTDETVAETAADPVGEKRAEILNRFPAKTIQSDSDLTGSRERSQIIDALPDEDIHYAIPLTEEVEGYLQDPHWLPGLDKHGNPARTMKPLRGLTIIMCERWYYDATVAAEQAEHDVRDASIGSRAAAQGGVNEKDDPQGGYGKPDVQINRGTLAERKSN